MTPDQLDAAGFLVRDRRGPVLVRSASRAVDDGVLWVLVRRDGATVMCDGPRGMVSRHCGVDDLLATVALVEAAWAALGGGGE